MPADVQIMTINCCSAPEHAALKADRLAFLRGTYYVGIQCVDSDFAVLLRNCRTCNSTLGIELDAAALERLTPPCAVPAEMEAA